MQGRDACAQSPCGALGEQEHKNRAYFDRRFWRFKRAAFLREIGLE
jgi:hypothetical protein